MSDEKETGTGEWQINSLDEEDDIIELTDEIEPPPPPGATRRDQLDEIVVDLDDGATPPAEEEVVELTEPAADEIGIEDLAPLDEADLDIIDLEEETLSTAAQERHDPFDGAADSVEFEDLEALESEDGGVNDLVEDSRDTPSEEIPDLTAEVFEDIDNGDASAVEENFENVIGLEDDSEAVMDDDLPGFESEAEEAVRGLSPDPFGVEDGEQPGTLDTETEVDIDEVADLEPIVPETIPEVDPLSENDAEPALHEKLATDFADPVPPPGDDIIDISEFDQQYFDDTPPGGETDSLSAADEAAEDDFLELIDVEDADDESADLDEEIIHLDPDAAESGGSELDDILSDPDHTEPELEPPAEQNTAPSPEISSRLTAEATAPILASGIEDSAEEDAPPDFFESSPGEDAGIRRDADGESTVEDDLDTGSEDIPAAISAVQVEAAVANIIERDYAGQIENMVATAIEKVVRLEIERIKARLFEDDPE